MFHTLYLKHQLRVVGKVRSNGRLLWKLEETPARARLRAREDQTRYYMLVDPKSFLPVYTRLIDLARPCDPTLSEVELSINQSTALPARLGRGEYLVSPVRGSVAARSDDPIMVLRIRREAS
jgi:hypothetical protein